MTDDSPDYLMQAPDRDEAPQADWDDLGDFEEPECYTDRRLERLYRKIPVDAPTEALLLRAFRAAANLYGVIALKDFLPIFEDLFPGVVSEKAFYAFAKVARHDLRETFELHPIFYVLGAEEIWGDRMVSTVRDRYIVSGALFYADGDALADGMARYGGIDLPFTRLPKDDFLAYADPRHVEPTPEGERLAARLMDETLPLGPCTKSLSRAEAVAYFLAHLRLYTELNAGNVFKDPYLQGFAHASLSADEMEALNRLLCDFCGAIRHAPFKGHTRAEAQPAIDRLLEPPPEDPEECLPQDWEPRTFAAAFSKTGADFDLSLTLTRYCAACVTLYAVAPLRTIWELIERDHPGLLTETRLHDLLRVIQHSHTFSFALCHLDGVPYLADKRNHTGVDWRKDVRDLLEMVETGLPYFLPTKEAIAGYGDRTEAVGLRPWCEDLKAETRLLDAVNAARVAPDILADFGEGLLWETLNIDCDDPENLTCAIEYLEEQYDIILDDATFYRLPDLIRDYAKTLRHPTLRGHTFEEAETLRAR